MSKHTIRTVILVLAAVVVGALGSKWLLSDSPDTATHTEVSQVSDGGHSHDWCAEHRVPESVCTQCNPALIEGFKEKNDWCTEHGIPESHCRLCNPGLTFPEEEHIASHGISTATADWCAEHRVPESVCTQCNSALIAEFKANNDWCTEHGIPESHCRLCNPGISFPQEPKSVLGDFTETVEPPTVLLRVNAPACATDDAIIQFASAETAERTGISVIPALEASRAYTIDAPGELIFDETNATAVTSSVPITVLRWLLEPGASVSIETPIAQVESQDMAKLQGEYLQALAMAEPARLRLTRADSMFKRQLISKAELELLEGEANSALSLANGIAGELKAAGLSEADILELERSRSASSRWLIRSASKGVLLERKAALGARLEEGTMIALTGDPDKLWVEAHLHEQYAEYAAPGQRIEFSVDGSNLHRLPAEIFWVAPFVDPDTRTITVRARPLEHNGGMVANRFGTAHFMQAKQGSGLGLAVPRDAVQWEGCCNVVFVQEQSGRFRPRKVQLATGDRNHYIITSGIKPGELIVVNGSFLLKTELMKTSLGAGCCGIEHKS